MKNRAEYEAFKAQFLRRLTIGLIITAALMMAFGGAYAYFSSSNMGVHGWIAMCVGIIFSFALAGVLTAVMVLGRRAGGDESAGEIDWE